MERKSRFFRIESDEKFNNIEEADKGANAVIAIVHRRMMKNENNACNVLIGISENRAGNGSLDKIYTGKKGRPKSKIISIHNKNSKTVRPHLHILIYSNPANTICRQIVEAINKSYRLKNKKFIARHYPIYGERGRYINYVLNQSIHQRKYIFDPFKKLEDFNFMKDYLFYKNNHPENNYFYGNDMNKILSNNNNNNIFKTKNLLQSIYISY